MNIIDSVFAVLGDKEGLVWGIADTKYSSFFKRYSRVIVLAQKYSHTLSSREFREEDYHATLVADRESLEQRVMGLKRMFDELGVESHVPPPRQEDEERLVAPLSFKYAATNAGIGWIGKSGVLVTREFGPRVRLAAILVDYPLECGVPMLKSLCGECRACVDACPWGAIKGVTWAASTLREELIDYHLCNEKRSEYISESGRKHECGYCILACPWGR